MQRKSKFSAMILAAAFASVAIFPGHASAGRFSIDINIGLPPAPPPHHSDVVVLDFDQYYVGYHRYLYDADWRLRNAQIEQWHAQDALDDARHHEGEIAVVVEDKEAFVAQFGTRAADSDAAFTAAHAAVARAEADADDARAQLHAYEKRAQGAKDDLEAGRTLHDAAAIEDAQRRIAMNEDAAAKAAADVRAAEARVAGFRAAEAAAGQQNEHRAQLIEVQAQLPRLHDDLAVAHDAVFAAQQRLDAAIGAVALALHDRDEALWLLHRDEILSGRAEFASCGFRIDLGVWGGRMPRDPEVVHAYFVHPVGYWVERPVEIQTRLVECDRIVEISRARQIQERHEGAHFREVVEVENHYPVERRREFAERVTVEREHLAAERTERATAAAEHRAPRIPESERVEARATVAKEHAEVRAEAGKERAEVRAEARTEERAKADARADEKARASAAEDHRTAAAPSSHGTPSADDRRSTRDSSRTGGSAPAADSRKPSSKDPRNKPRDGQASIDLSR